MTDNENSEVSWGQLLDNTDDEQTLLNHARYYKEALPIHKNNAAISMGVTAISSVLANAGLKEGFSENAMDAVMKTGEYLGVNLLSVTSLFQQNKYMGIAAAALGGVALVNSLVCHAQAQISASRSHALFSKVAGIHVDRKFGPER